MSPAEAAGAFLLKKRVGHEMIVQSLMHALPLYWHPSIHSKPLKITEFLIFNSVFILIFHISVVPEM